MTNNRDSPGASVLAAGSVLAQTSVLIGLATAAQFVPASHFAYYGAATSVAFLSAPLFSLGVEARIPALVSRRLAVVSGAALVNAIIGFCSSVVALLIALLAGLPVWTHVVLTGLSTGSILAVHNVGYALLVQTHQMARVASFRAIQGFVNGALLLVLAPTLHSWFALMVAWACSMAVTWVATRFDAFRAVQPSFPSCDRYRQLLSEVGMQPLSMLVSALANNLSFIALPLLIGPAVAGVWAFVGRIGSGATVMAAHVLTPRFLGSAGALLRSGRQPELSLLYNRTLLECGAAGIAFGLVFTAILMTYVTHVAAEWAEVAWLIPFALLPSAAQVVFSPTTSVLVLLGKQRAHFYWEMGRIIAMTAMLGLFFGLSTHLKAEAVIVTWSIFSASAYLPLLALHRHHLRRLGDVDAT